MWGADDDDSDFLAPGGPSKLGALFGGDQAVESNTSLKYTAPKEPKKKSPEPAKGGSATGILNAAAVHAYKFIEDKYVSQGKLGAAIIANHELADYKVLLYLSKQQPVTTAKISALFSFTVQENKYANFYDDSRTSWSILFDTDAAQLEFSKQVCLAKGLSGRGSEFVGQSLSTGEGGALESGDSAEVKYTGWLLQNHGFGEVFDSNENADKLFRFKLGKGKVIKGWEEGILGMKKNERKLLIVPSELGYGKTGQPPKIPGNSTLIFQIEVVRVKLAKGGSENDTVSASNPGPPLPSLSRDTRAPSVSSLDSEADHVKALSKSMEDQTAHKGGAQSDKAKLIAKIAKMGQSMLPVADSESPPDEDTNDVKEESRQPPASPHRPEDPPGIAPRPAHLPAHHQGAAVSQQPLPPHQYYNGAPLVSHAAPHDMTQQPPPQQQLPFPQYMPGMTSSSLAVYQPMQPYAQQQQAQMYNPPPPPPHYGQMYATPPQPQPPPPPQPQQTSSGTVEVLASEARQQNTELRLSISKMADKVDRVYEKLDYMSSQNQSSLALTGNSPNMETGVLLHNIQRIIQENERLKKELFEKSTRIEGQNEKIADLLQRNQKFVEQSNVLLEQRNDSFKSTAAQSQAKVLTLEQEKVSLATELSAATAQVGALQLEVAAQRKAETELRAQLQNVLTGEQAAKEQLTQLRLRNSESETSLEQANSQLKDEKQLRKNYESQLTTLREELSELKQSKEVLEKSLTERKQKSSEEKKKLEEENEELKAQYEEEITSLKDKLRRQKSSTDATTAEQITKIENELNQDWQEKCDRLIASANDKHRRQVQELEEEKVEAEEKVRQLEEKLSSLRSDRASSEEQLAALQEEMEELKAWKEKYGKLRSQAGAMKERYEARIEELEAEREEAEEARAALAERCRQLQRQQVAPVRGGEAEGTGDTEAEVKKIMNQVFHMLKSQFSADQKYPGTSIHKAVLETIKTVTLQMLSKTPAEEDDEEETEEEESDDESEEDPSTEQTFQKEAKENVNEDRKADVISESNSSSVKNEKNNEEMENKDEKLNDNVTVLQSTVAIAVDANTLTVDKNVDESQHSPVNVEIGNVGGENNGATGDGAIESHKQSDGELIVSEENMAEKNNENSDNGSTVDPLQNVGDVSTVNDDKLNDDVSADEKRADDNSKKVDESFIENADVESFMNGNEDAVTNINEDVVTNVDEDGVGNVKEDDVPNVDEKSVTNVNEEFVVTNVETVTNVKEDHVSNSPEDGVGNVDEDSVTKVSEDENGRSLVKNDDMKSDLQEDKVLNETPEDSETEIAHEKVDNSASADANLEEDLQEAMDESIEDRMQSIDDSEVGEEVKSTASEQSTDNVDKTQVGDDDEIAPQTAAQQHAPAPSQGDANKPTGETESKSAAKEKAISSTSAAKTGDKGNPHYAKELEKAAMSKLENPVKSSVSSVTGDKGNPHYAKELDQGAEDKVVAVTVTATTASSLGSAKADKNLGKKDAVIEPKKGAVSGDKGNPFYAKLLDESDDMSDALQAVVAAKHGDIKAEKGAKLGDKGNPHYAKELASDGPIKSDKVSASQSQPSSAQPTLKEEKVEAVQQQSVSVTQKPKDSGIKEVIKPEKEQVTGDKGNQHYAKELDKAAANSKAKEKAVTASVTGDKGNPHYAKELEKESISPSKMSPSSVKPPQEEVIKADIVTAVNAQPASASKPPGDEAKVAPKKAAVSGDKGNPHYKKELDKSEQQKPKEQKLSPVSASKTGDKGNPHYAKELDKEAVVKVQTSSTNQAVPLEAEVIKPQSASISQAPPTSKASKEKKTSSPSSKQRSESKINPVSSLVTGDQGNPHYGKELEKGGSVQKQKEKEIAKTDASKCGDKGNVHYAKELEQEVIAKQSASISKASPQKETTPKGSQPEDKVKFDKAAVCGDKGNANYAKELDNAAKKTSAESAKTKAEKPQTDESKIQPSKSSVTGDKGNPHYAKELQKSHEEKADIFEPPPLAAQMGNEEESDDDLFKVTAALSKKTKSKKDDDIFGGSEGKKGPAAEKKKITDAKALFGDDDDDDDLFSTPSAKKPSAPKSTSKTTPKSSSKPSKKVFKDDGSDDEMRKPPPLFGSDDDDDDLEWLSK